MRADIRRMALLSSHAAMQQQQRLSIVKCFWKVDFLLLCWTSLHVCIMYSFAGESLIYIYISSPLSRYISPFFLLDDDRISAFVSLLFLMDSTVIHLLERRRPSVSLASSFLCFSLTWRQRLSLFFLVQNSKSCKKLCTTTRHACISNGEDNFLQECNVIYIQVKTASSDFHSRNLVNLFYFSFSYIFPVVQSKRKEKKKVALFIYSIAFRCGYDRRLYVPCASSERIRRNWI